MYLGVFIPRGTCVDRPHHGGCGLVQLHQQLKNVSTLAPTQGFQLIGTGRARFQAYRVVLSTPYRQNAFDPDLGSENAFDPSLEGFLTTPLMIFVHQVRSFPLTHLTQQPEDVHHGVVIKGNMRRVSLLKRKGLRPSSRRVLSLEKQLQSLQEGVANGDFTCRRIGPDKEAHLSGGGGVVEGPSQLREGSLEGLTGRVHIFGPTACGGLPGKDIFDNSLAFGFHEPCWFGIHHHLGNPRLGGV